MKRQTLIDLLCAVGALVISGGIALIYPPAGVIALGVAVILFAVLLIDVEGVIGVNLTRRRKAPQR